MSRIDVKRTSQIAGGHSRMLGRPTVAAQRSIRSLRSAQSRRGSIFVRSRQPPITDHIRDWAGIFVTLRIFGQSEIRKHPIC
jgi:hypothetical protein